jgi:hypothetical protein
MIKSLPLEGFFIINPIALFYKGKIFPSFDRFLLALIS